MSTGGSYVGGKKSLKIGQLGLKKTDPNPNNPANWSNEKVSTHMGMLKPSTPGKSNMKCKHL